MSQFNQAPEQKNVTGQKNNSIIYWVIILILLSACVFLYLSRNNMAKEKQTDEITFQKQKDSISTDLNALQTDFNAASAKIDQLVSQNANLDSALQGKNNEMAKLRGDIRGILSKNNATKEELKRAAEMINSLKDKSKQYEERIAELEKENQVLTGKNEVLTKERDSTVGKNIALKKIGSVLHASNIRMEPIHKRRNGKEKETSKAKKVDILRILFDIDENRIAESGNKAIYIRMIAPDATIMGNPANISGMMTIATGGQLGYSMVKEIALTQNEKIKDVAIDWNQEGDYKKGQYTIEVYNEGFKIGSGTVTLK
jgi:hypothetical protein